METNDARTTRDVGRTVLHGSRSIWPARAGRQSGLVGDVRRPAAQGRAGRSPLPRPRCHRAAASTWVRNHAGDRRAQRRNVPAEPRGIYPTLQLLEELGHARVEEQDGRKVYAITPQGKADLETHRDEVKDFYERSGAGNWEDYAEELGDLMRHAGRMFKMFRRGMRRGRLTPTTLKKLRAVLDEAMSKIEALIEPEGKEPR